MKVLDPAQIAWLLRELEVAGVVAMRRAAPYLSQKLWLAQQLPRVAIAQDAGFQLRLSRHLGLRGKLRQSEPALFALMSEFIAQPPASFEAVLRPVSAITGQVEKSVASELFALFDPVAPVIDRELRELLPRYGFDALAEAPSLQECLEWHGSLQGLFEQILSASHWPVARDRLQLHLDAPLRPQVSEQRMLNAALSHARRTIALMPVPRLQPERPAAPRENRVLHVCR
jgi:hypothetical protein